MGERVVDLNRVARVQRRLLWVILGVLLTQVAFFALPGLLPRGGGGPGAGVGVWFLALPLIALAMQIVAILLVVRLSSVSGTHWAWVLLLGLLMLAPCINLLVMLGVNQHATSMLKRRGLKVGLMGVPKGQLEKLEGSRCRGCGYDMTGIAAQPCPECGERFPLAYQ